MPGRCKRVQNLWQTKRGRVPHRETARPALRSQLVCAELNAEGSYEYWIAKLGMLHPMKESGGKTECWCLEIAKKYQRMLCRGAQVMRSYGTPALNEAHC